MGASTLMSIGTRAMAANFASLQTVGNNIANANTQGYSRQEVQLGTAGGQYTGAGFFGQGVNVTLGLPIVRTSVDHGTAFDIAWKGVAFTDSLRDACAMARRLSRR